jgi:hypothetical protein
MSPEMTEIASKDFCPHRLNVQDKFGIWKLQVRKWTPESGSELAFYVDSYWTSHRTREAGLSGGEGMQADG